MQEGGLSTRRRAAVLWGRKDVFELPLPLSDVKKLTGSSFYLGFLREPEPQSPNAVIMQGSWPAGIPESG